MTRKQRYDVIVEAALDYMTARDWYYAEEDDDPEVLADLDRLYDADLPPTPCTGNLLVDTGVTLALEWAAERRADYERSLPVWACDCGAVYKREPVAALYEHIYTVTADGEFDEPVGSTRGKRGIGAVPRDDRYVLNNGGCPSCGRSFKATIERQLDPQTSLLI